MRLIKWSVLCLIALLVSCGKAPEPKVIRVGFNTWPGYEFIYLAQVKGFYAEQGLTVKLVELNSLGDVRRAFERGQIDVMASTMVETLVAAESTRQPISIIAVTDASYGADVLLTKKESSLQSMADIKGRSMGMEAATVDVLVASAALESVGLTLNDVNVVTGAQDDLVAQLAAGKLDSLQTYPPYSIKLMQTNEYRVLFDTKSIPGRIFDILSVKREFETKNRAELDRFLTAYFKAYDYFFANKQESAAIMGKREGISAEEFIAAVNDIQVFGRTHQAEYFEGGKAKLALKSAIDALKLSQVISTEMSPDDFIQGGH